MERKMFRVSRVVLTTVFVMVFAFSLLAGFLREARAADEYALIVINGEKVNIRPDAGTKGAIITQCNTGEAFVAYAETVKGSDGKQWYKLAATVDAKREILKALADDSRFKGSSVGYVSAQFVGNTSVLSKEAGAEFEELLAASKASSRFLPVVVDGTFLGGYQNAKWVKAEDLTFRSKGKNLTFNEASGAMMGEVLYVDFAGLPKGAKLAAYISGQKKATVTLEDEAVFVHFMGWVGVDMDKLPEKDEGRAWICLDETLPGAAAATVFQEGNVSVIAFATEGDEGMSVELTRDPARDGVNEIGVEEPYENYSASVRYGGKSYGLDGDVGEEGINLYPDDWKLDCVFIDVNGDGRQELVLHCRSHTRGAWVYELGSNGPKEVLSFNVTNVD
jgi:hypothetical protein